MRAWASATSALCSGIGRGSGVSGRSHSSVHAVRSMRAGLPVSDRDRTVSEDVAARNFSLTTGASRPPRWSATPTAPHAFGAEGQGRGDLAAPRDAAGGQHGRRRHRVDHLGHQHHGRDLAGVAAGLGALRDDQVHAGGGVPARVFGGSGQAATSTSWPWARSTRSGGGGPRALAISRMLWAKATSSSGS